MANTPTSGELLDAVQQRDTAAVKTMLAQGADVNKADEEAAWTPLSCAAVYGNCQEIIELLLDKGADVNQEDGWGKAALHLAAENGDTESVRLLVDRGADIHQRDSELGKTALLWAADNRHFDGYVETVRLLLDKGADINDKGLFGNWTALMYAAELGHVGVVRLLIDRGASLDEMNKDGQTALMIAVQSEHKEIVEMLKDTLAKKAEIALEEELREARGLKRDLPYRGPFRPK